MLKENEYTNNKELLEKDIKDFIDKINITREEFDKIMFDGTRRKHEDFKNYNDRRQSFRKLKRIVKKIIKRK